MVHVVARSHLASWSPILIKYTASYRVDQKCYPFLSPTRMPSISFRPEPVTPTKFCSQKFWKFYIILLSVLTISSKLHQKALFYVPHLNKILRGKKNLLYVCIDTKMSILLKTLQISKMRNITESLISWNRKYWLLFCFQCSALIIDHITMHNYWRSPT